MTNRYALRDDQWERIQELLPGRAGHVGGPAQENRRFVDAVLDRYRAGISRDERALMDEGGPCHQGISQGHPPFLAELYSPLYNSLRYREDG